MSETNEPTAKAPQRSRWGIDPERLAALRARVREAVKGNSGDFKIFKQGSEALREIDAVTTEDPQS